MITSLEGTLSCFWQLFRGTSFQMFFLVLSKSLQYAIILTLKGMDINDFVKVVILRYDHRP